MFGELRYLAGDKTAVQSVLEELGGYCDQSLGRKVQPQQLRMITVACSIWLQGTARGNDKQSRKPQ